MTILITKQNQQIIRDILPNVKFTESTKNTCTFNVKESTFNRLIQEVRLMGINPYALMYW